jgi:hypothetical protein
MRDVIIRMPPADDADNSHVTILIQCICKSKLNNLPAAPTTTDTSLFSSSKIIGDMDDIGHFAGRI